ncbi:Chanoclavine-I aldehyde reductase [Grifola frondosa]|uniref:Chanoclavine-I aldehyde reductase n=1 Tax=Grifola frondosa TaxID=5627 RepID=A0A1C7MBZ5_GRIFR|nr:Chanoclavine-I aldehyde reductase [Grifola frondosa]
MRPNLFSPIKVGDITLSHRVALAPLTRCRADAAHTPTEAAVKYYDQRAREPGTLLITEATFIAAKAGGQKRVPGIWSDEQVSAWKKVTDAVHRHGSHIFLQLWAVGRHAFVEDALAEDLSFEYVSSSPYPWPSPSDPQRTPRALTVLEIHEYVELFATAARNAVHRAGFDGVEVHGANGYLIQQFLNDVSNFRQDGYGGSIEARCRFALEVMEAVVNAVGEKKTAIRLSPFERWR